MRLKQLDIAGFRGFNTPRTIIFHDCLTLISAPNSHGKTSITEALEFLLFGETSKVETADSKDEYKDSYLNRHFTPNQQVFVEARFAVTSGPDVTLRVETDGKDVRRYVDGLEVDDWPFSAAIQTAARPFVVQHALKSLLLAAPSQRFQGFARLLGLREVDALQQMLVNLCTKPESQIPQAAKRLLGELSVFDGRLRAIKETVPIAKALDRGSGSGPEAFEKLHERACKLVGKRVAAERLSAALVELRNAAAAKVYAGSVAIQPLTSLEKQNESAILERVRRTLDATFVESYGRLAVRDTKDRLKKELQLLNIGLNLLEGSSGFCPLCQQELNEAQLSNIGERRNQLSAAVDPADDQSKLRVEFATDLKQLASDLKQHSSVLSGRAADLIAANTPENSEKIKALFGKGNEHGLLIVAAAGAAITPVHVALLGSAQRAILASEVCEDAIQAKAEDLAQGGALVRAVGEYLTATENYSRVLDDIGPTLAEPSQLLQKAVDAQAGTTELSLLIEILSKRSEILRAVRIKETLAGLKDLKRHVDQAVGQTMEEAFSTDLTGSVMTWYEKIKTTGDPDVHFSGFTMERTRSGDYKSRRVKVAARSYGVELASAVSSLSESKLNALGLCMSIATALRAPGPWHFLVLDDPVQSWDEDHEFQFIQMIRTLAESEKRQIILMSHRETWIDQVADVCRSLNGVRYHISGYTKDGPHIQERDWSTLDQRLREAITIASDPAATIVRLQQAEQEIRTATCQLTAEVSRVVLARLTSTRSMNSDKVRSVLNEAGCPVQLLDRVVATFATTDEAHHAPEDYAPNAQRIRQYHGALSELKNWLSQHPTR